MKTCTKCGETKPLSEFRKWRRQCKECERAYSRAYNRDNPEKGIAWVQANRDRVAAINAKWNKVHADRRSAINANYHEANRDEINARHSSACRANPHIGWENLYRQRCRRFGIDPVIESFTREELIAEYGDACFYCDDGAFEHLDHYLCVAAGGPHTLANTRPCCVACNLTKGHITDRADVAAFRKARGDDNPFRRDATG